MTIEYPRIVLCRENISGGATNSHWWVLDKKCSRQSWYTSCSNVSSIGCVLSHKLHCFTILLSHLLPLPKFDASHSLRSESEKKSIAKRMEWAGSETRCSERKLFCASFPKQKLLLKWMPIITDDIWYKEQSNITSKGELLIFGFWSSRKSKGNRTFRTSVNRFELIDSRGRSGKLYQQRKSNTNIEPRTAENRRRCFMNIVINLLPSSTASKNSSPVPRDGLLSVATAISSTSIISDIILAPNLPH